LVNGFLDYLFSLSGWSYW